MTAVSDRNSEQVGPPDEASDFLPADFHVVPSPVFRWKGAVGRLLAVVMLIPGLPIISFLVILVRLTSRGPGIYRQVRVGRNGKIFKMYKIRTMRNDAEALSGPTWTQKDDPRVTPLGRLLRRLHLDELPQMFNVVLGEMDLIGPRPERPEFTRVLAGEIPGYLNRLAVLPGITGLAQINLPPDTDLDSVRRKLILDLEYIEIAGAMLEIRMFLCTLLRMLGVRGDSAMQMMGVRRDVKLAERHLATHAAATHTTEGHATPTMLLSASRKAGNGEAHSQNGNGAQEARRPKPMPEEIREV